MAAKRIKWSFSSTSLQKFSKKSSLPKTYACRRYTSLVYKNSLLGMAAVFLFQKIAGFADFSIIILTVDSQRSFNRIVNYLL
jgi:hypothetical protein